MRGLGLLVDILLILCLPEQRPSDDMSLLRIDIGAFEKSTRVSDTYDVRRLSIPQKSVCLTRFVTRNG
jgi:hypothetical protein